MKLNKITIISILTSSLLLAMAPKELNKEATDLLKSNQATKAYALLKKEYKKGNFDNQTLFLLGTSAKQQNDLDGAIKYFEELLSREKGAHRVRLDLASIYYKKGELDRAKELLLVVKSSNPPEKVGDNINSFLAAIEKGTPRNWNIRLSVGYVFDSNANAGPDTDTVLMYNLPFDLSTDAKESDDFAINYSASLNHLYKFEKNSKFYWQSSFGFNGRDYNKLNNLDSLSLYLSSGPSLDKGKFKYSLPIILSTVKIGHEDRYYSYSRGLVPQLSYSFAPNFSISSSLSLNDKIYYENPTRDSKSVTFSLSSRYFLDQSSFFDMGGYKGRESSKTDTYTNASQGLNLGYYKAFSQKLNLYLSTSYSVTDYHGLEVAYNTKRKDSLASVGANLSYYLEMVKSNMAFNVSYTQNDSNIVMYEYKRTQAGLTISTDF